MAKVVLKGTDQVAQSVVRLRPKVRVAGSTPLVGQRFTWWKNAGEVAIPVSSMRLSGKHVRKT